MCYASPGPRCSRSILDEKESLEGRIAKLSNAIKTAESRDIDTSSLLSERAHLVEKLSKTMEDYEVTNHYQKNLKRQMKNLEDAKMTKTSRYGVLSAELKSSQDRRARMLANLELAKLAKKRTEPYEDVLAKMESDTRSPESEELTADVTKKSQELADAKTALETASQDVARAYRDAGNPRRADQPALWSGDDFAPNQGELFSDDTPYERYTVAQAKVRAAQDAYNEASERKRNSDSQGAIGQLMLNRRRAEIASGIEPGDTYPAYGKTHVEPDGKTNALYRTTIPGTTTEIFARVEKVENGCVHLETGENFPLTQTSPGRYLFRIPSEGAKPGPEVYRMDSSG